MSNELLNSEGKLEKTGNYHLLTSRNVPVPLLLCLWDVVLLDTEGPREAKCIYNHHYVGQDQSPALFR